MNADFEFHTIQIDNKSVVVLIICRAVNQSVKFKKADYIRVGSCTKKLVDHPELQAKLWERLRTTQYEDLLAKTNLTADQSLQLIDWPLYFELKEEPQPTTQEGILHYMLEEGIVVHIPIKGISLSIQNKAEYSFFIEDTFICLDEGKNVVNDLANQCSYRLYAGNTQNCIFYSSLINTLTPEKIECEFKAFSINEEFPSFENYEFSFCVYPVQNSNKS